VLARAQLPENLVRTVAQCPPGAPMLAWLYGLPDVVADLAKRWSLDLGPPFQPGGSASWVAPARDRAGAALVLKVGWRHDEALHEVDGLRAWHGNGAVRLIDAAMIGQTCALLLEACEPGTALSTLASPREQDEVVAGLLRALWIEPVTGHPFRSLASMCDRWVEEFESKYPASDPVSRIDRGLARSGTELFRELPRTAQASVLLCTDLHAENILSARRAPWLVIDPKPYLGDPTYDPLQHMLNCPDRIAREPDRFVSRMAGLLGLDADRLRHWLFARCVLESADEPNLRALVPGLAP
jgi:streptomycin 6-kinase